MEKVSNMSVGLSLSLSLSLSLFCLKVVGRIVAKSSKSIACILPISLLLSLSPPLILCFPALFLLCSLYAWFLLLFPYDLWTLYTQRLLFPLYARCSCCWCVFSKLCVCSFVSSARPRQQALSYRWFPRLGVLPRWRHKHSAVPLPRPSLALFHLQLVRPLAILCAACRTGMFLYSLRFMSVYFYFVCLTWMSFCPIV